MDNGRMHAVTHGVCHSRFSSVEPTVVLTSSVDAEQPALRARAGPWPEIVSRWRAGGVTAASAGGPWQASPSYIDADRIAFWFGIDRRFTVSLGAEASAGQPRSRALGTLTGRTRCDAAILRTLAHRLCSSLPLMLDVGDERRVQRLALTIGSSHYNSRDHPSRATPARHCGRR
jgi:hypothetical protein